MFDIVVGGSFVHQVGPCIRWSPTVVPHKRTKKKVSFETPSGSVWSPTTPIMEKVVPVPYVSNRRKQQDSSPGPSPGSSYITMSDAFDDQILTEKDQNKTNRLNYNKIWKGHRTRSSDWSPEDWICQIIIIINFHFWEHFLMSETMYACSTYHLWVAGFHSKILLGEVISQVQDREVVTYIQNQIEALSQVQRKIIDPSVKLGCEEATILTMRKKSLLFMKGLHRSPIASFSSSIPSLSALYPRCATQLRGKGVFWLCTRFLERTPHSASWRVWCTFLGDA
jgi:hypothetical protein